MPSRACPSRQQLHAFQLGDLPEASLSEVAEHLEGCPQCESLACALDTVADSILTGIRGQAPRTPVVDTRKVPDSAPGPRGPALEAKNATAYAFLRPAVEPDEIGRLGDYRVLRLLGKGGMAFVFLAEDLTLRRPVALKVMKPELGEDAEGWQRFLREARIMAAIKHRHLVTVYQVGQESSAVYLAMELLQGESLGTRLERQADCNLVEVLRLGQEIAGGLTLVHRQGLIHRDIKPDNIWLEAPDDNVKILDFGLARHVHDDNRITQTGTIMGTPSYMSPEQARGANIDFRTDLFSLGAVLYCLCTGRGPFQAEHTMAILTALAMDKPRPVHELNPAIPQALSDLIMQLLSKNPDERPASADVVFERLRRIGADFSAVPPDSQGGRITRRLHPGASQGTLSLRKLKPWAGIAGMLVLAIGVGAVLLQWGPGPADSTPAAVRSSPAPIEKEEAVYLASLTPVASAHWPLPSAPPDKKKMRNVFEEIRVNGQLYPNGIGLHPSFDGPASVSYALDGAFREFHAEVSNNDTSKGSYSPMTFTLFGDGNELWKSKPVTNREDAQPCKVSVKGVKVLKLQVSAADKASGAHGVWLDPRVLR